MYFPINDKLIKDFYMDTYLSTINSDRFDGTEDSDGTTLSYELPGIKREHISVEIDKQRLLTVSWEDYKWTPARKDWRAYAIPEYLDPDAVTAQLEDGVLTIRIPRRETAKARKIPIG